VRRQAPVPLDGQDDGRQAAVRRRRPVMPEVDERSCHVLSVAPLLPAPDPAIAWMYRLAAENYVGS
jgi:hypothetical protein